MLLKLPRHLLFLFPSVMALVSCGNETTLCEGDDCAALTQSALFVRLENGNDRPHWHRFTGSGLTALEGMYPGSTPLAYHAGLDLLAAKSLSGDGMRLTLYRGGGGVLTEETTRNQANTDEMSALCMTGDGHLWLLHRGRYDEEDPRAGRYILSRGSTALKEWDNFFLTGDSEEDTLYGSVIEKPVHLFCGEDGREVFLTTFLYSGETERSLLRLPRLSLLQVYLYRFDPAERLLQPVAGFTPRGNGPVRAHYDSRSGRFAVFQNGRLSLQKGLGFPEEREYPESSEALFSQEGGPFRLFLISKDRRGIRGRIERP